LNLRMALQHLQIFGATLLLIRESSLRRRIVLNGHKSFSMIPL